MYLQLVTHTRKIILQGTLFFCVEVQELLPLSLLHCVVCACASASPRVTFT